MIKETKLQTLFIGLFVLFVSQNAVSQCENLAMAFDGNDDYVTLNTTTTPVTGNADFTAEAWFYSSATNGGTCSGNF
ncbi:MAG: hypothetical protein IPN33_06380 [Saprospiraceae bacterium]|nr:hypothetical protein [Saprospiraceae bacterium]